MKLNEKQKNFCKEYVKDFNATQAALRAGYSKNTARSIACQHLTKLNIKQEIARLTEKKVVGQEITVNDIVQRLIDIVNLDPIEIYSWGAKIVGADPDGNFVKGSYIQLKDIGDIPKKYRRMVQAVAETKEGVKVQFMSKEKALELLGKHYAMFTDKIQHEGNQTQATVIIEIPSNNRKDNV